MQSRNIEIRILGTCQEADVELGIIVTQNYEIPLS